MAGAQVFGGGSYGCTSEVSTLGLYIATVSYDMTSNTGFGMNHVGDEALISVGNFGGNLNFSGLTSTANSLGAALGEALEAADIGNSAVFSVTAEVTVWIVNGGNLTRNQAGFQEGSLAMIGRTAMTSATPVAVT